MVSSIIEVLARAGEPRQVGSRSQSAADFTPSSSGFGWVVSGEKEWGVVGWGAPFTERFTHARYTEPSRAVPCRAVCSLPERPPRTGWKVLAEVAPLERAAPAERSRRRLPADHPTPLDAGRPVCWQWNGTVGWPASWTAAPLAASVPTSENSGRRRGRHIPSCHRTGCGSPASRPRNRGAAFTCRSEYPPPAGEAAR